MKIRPVVVIATAVLAVAACSKSTNDSATTRDGAKVTMKTKGDRSQMEITNKSGEKTTLSVSDTNLKPATEVPADLPVYPKARLRMDNNTPSLRMLGYVTADPVADGVKFYSEEMPKQGWTVSASMAMGEGHMITAKKDNRNCQLMISKDGKETYIQVTLNTTS